MKTRTRVLSILVAAALLVATAIPTGASSANLGAAQTETGEVAFGASADDADVTAPTVAWSAIPAFVNATTLGVFSVSWAASDAAPGSGVASVTVQRQEAPPTQEGGCDGVAWAGDGASYTIPVAQGSSLFQNNLPRSAGACYRWTAYATDVAGNVGLAVTSSATFLDTTPPTINGFCENNNGRDCLNSSNPFKLPPTWCSVIAHDSAVGAFGSGLSRVWCGSAKPAALPAASDPGWASVGAGVDIPQWASPPIPVITTPAPLDGMTLYVIAVDQAGNDSLDPSNPGSTVGSIGIDVVEDCTLPPAQWVTHPNFGAGGAISVVWAVGKPLCLIPHPTGPAFPWARISNGLVETGTVVSSLSTVVTRPPLSEAAYGDCSGGDCSPYQGRALKLDLYKETPAGFVVTVGVGVGGDAEVFWTNADGTPVTGPSGTTGITGYNLTASVNVSALNTGQTWGCGFSC